jgi:hypothetical protein
MPSPLPSDQLREKCERRYGSLSKAASRMAQETGLDSYQSTLILEGKAPSPGQWHLLNPTRQPE